MSPETHIKSTCDAPDTRNPLQPHIQIDPRLAERAEAITRRRRVGDHLRRDDLAALRQVAAQPVGGARSPAGRCVRPGFVCRPQLRWGDVAASDDTARSRRFRQADQPWAAVAEYRTGGTECFRLGDRLVVWRSATSNSWGGPGRPRRAGRDAVGEFVEQLGDHIPDCGNTKPAEPALIGHVAGATGLRNVAGATGLGVTRVSQLIQNSSPKPQWDAMDCRDPVRLNTVGQNQDSGQSVVLQGADGDGTAETGSDRT